MSKLIKNIVKLITNTPMKMLSNIHNGPGRICAKLEYVQPGGSVKDRAAYAAIVGAKEDGILKPG